MFTKTKTREFRSGELLKSLQDASLPAAEAPAPSAPFVSNPQALQALKYTRIIARQVLKICKERHLTNNHLPRQYYIWFYQNDAQLRTQSGHILTTDDVSYDHLLHFMRDIKTGWIEEFMRWVELQEKTLVDHLEALNCACDELNNAFPPIN